MKTNKKNPMDQSNFRRQIKSQEEEKIREEVLLMEIRTPWSIRLILAKLIQPNQLFIQAL